MEAAIPNIRELSAKWGLCREVMKKEQLAILLGKSGILLRKGGKSESCQRASRITAELVPVVLKEQVTREVISHFIPLINIEDQRCSSKIAFSAQSLLFVVSLSYLCGLRSAVAMGNFWEQHQKFLSCVIPEFPERLVSHDTIKRTMENMVFERFSLFFTRFTERLLYEALNDLHLQHKLPESESWLFKLVLQEHASLERQDQQDQEHMLRPMHTKDKHLLPYQVIVHNTATKQRLFTSEQIKAQKQYLSLVAQMREYEFQGAASNVTFTIEKDNGGQL